MQYKDAFKHIRKSKNISQQELAKNILSQSSLSKFENGDTSLDFNNFFLLMERMNLSVEEFIFYSNDYQLSAKEEIINKFYNLNFNNLKELKKLRISCLNYLKEKQDVDIDEICEIILFLILNHKEEKMDKFVECIIPVWNRVAKTDEFFIRDIKIMNNLLFLFPIESIKELTDIMIKKCNKYKGYMDAVDILILKIKLNASSLYLQNNLFKDALYYLNDLEKNHRENMTVYMYSILLSRKAICTYKLNIQHDYLKIFENVFLLLEIYQEKDFKEIVIEEVNLYIHDESIMNKIISIKEKSIL